MYTHKYTHTCTQCPEENVESFTWYKYFIDLSKVRVEHLHISTAIKDYMFVSSNINMYQADEIFTMRKRKWKWLWAMFITKNGTSKEKIIWIMSGNDIALIDDFVMWN